AGRKVKGRAEAHHLGPQVKTLVGLADIAHCLKRDQAATRSGGAQTYPARHVAQRHLGMLGIKAFQNGQPLGERLDEFRWPVQLSAEHSRKPQSPGARTKSNLIMASGLRSSARSPATSAL